MGVGRGRQGWALAPPGFWNYKQKKVVFSISRGKKQISPLLAPPGKNFGKIPYLPPPGKNPSDAHASATALLVKLGLFSLLGRSKSVQWRAEVWWCPGRLRDCMPPTKFQYWAVAYGGHYYWKCAVCDVTIWRHIHVCKTMFWWSLLTQHAYYSTRTLLTICTVYHNDYHKL